MIIDKNGNEITNPDLSRGYLTEETMTVHHDAIEAVEEVSHYEVVAEFANGGILLEKVIDTPKVEGMLEYDEVVTIHRYHETLPEDAGEEPSMEDRLSALEMALLDMMMEV